MSLFRSSKTMLRQLTDAERREIKDFIKLNPVFTPDFYAEYFEEKFHTPITLTCIQNIEIEMTMEIMDKVP
jgi:hypothetical protein